MADEVPKNVTKEQALSFYEKGKQQVERIRGMAMRTKEKSDELVTEVVSTMETVGAAFLAGLALGRYGEVLVAGVPADLALGIVGKMGALALTLAGSKRAGDIHAASTGFIAAWANRKGAQIGAAQLTASTTADAKTPKPITTAAAAGLLPQAGHVARSTQSAAERAAIEAANHAVPA